MTAGAVSAPLIIPIIHLQTHRAKNHINTDTPVCLQSDTPGVHIFYTLDGSSPAALQVQGGSSRKYSEPVLLPAGRVSVRAVAVTSDGRRSSTVTKLFNVQLVESDRKQSDDGFLLSGRQRPSGGTSSSAGSSLRPPEPKTNRGESRPQSGPRFLSSRLGRPAATARTASSRRSRSASPGVLQQLDATHAARIHRHTDFLRCARCLSVRPSDPFARFCSQCGAALPVLPGHRAPPAEGGQVVSCVFCNTLVPANTHTCLTCEAPVQQQLQPLARVTLQDPVLCSSCGSGNPAHFSSCLTCESRLQPVTRGDGGCCGSQASCVTCWRCGASGHLSAAHCPTCGVHLDALAPPTSCCDITRPAGGVANNQASTPTSHDASWQAPPPPGPAPKQVASRHTQTVGLYFPSATELHRKEQHASRQRAAGDRQPPLTAISPGRGYWRKQLDHVCAHLRSYAQNNAPFRALLGEPRLGQMVSAVIQDDGQEVSVTASFVSAGREEPVRAAGGGGGVAVGGALSAVMQRSSDSSSLRSDLRSGGLRPAGPKPNPKPPVQDVRLLAELSAGRGRVTVVQELLDQGADPSCCDGAGRHALALAVMNGHHEVLPVLLQRGADVDQQSGPMKNSALHEAAAARGSDGLRCAQVLLSCKAGVRRRNAGGQTAYDVAVTCGSDAVASLLAARTGLELLSRTRLQPV